MQLKDVGHAELGAENYATSLRYNGRDAVGFGVLQLPDANTLDVYRNVVAELDRLSARFPPGLKYRARLRHDVGVSESIHEVLVTLFEAIGIVIIVIFLFLQSWRRTLIPAITIPGLARRHVHLRQALRLLDQHADAVRPHARDRASSSTTRSS